MKNQTAFTLIELLVVVAIISILASMALPNFHHAQIKAKTTAALAEMRSLSTAIEAYQMDHNKYPLDGNDYFDLQEDRFDQKTIQRVLTTPTAYISQIPEDLFHTKETHVDDPLTARYFISRPPYPYLYFTKDNFWLHRGAPRAYRIFSLGPDLFFNNDSRRDEDYLVYDVSNGVISDGDILFKGP
ncbi:MAG: type II secretion system protein [Candidatus Omnitrophota bacterium]|jgi:prepilin-type N-terminal cleavage/methylation domain-containing protein|nr:MAG: type II secretion system protein [Candidatus Omnitrophota bacterium]